MKINNSKDLLGSMLKTTQMGQEGIRSVLGKPMDPALRQNLRDQIAAYDRIETETRELLNSRAWKTRELGNVPKAMSKMASHMKLMGHDRDSRIAAMMIQGNTRGVIKGMRNLNRYHLVDPPVTDLAQRLVDTEMDAIRTMQSFL